MNVVLPLGRLKPESHHKFKVSLSHSVNPRIAWAIYIMWDFISKQEKMRVKLLIAQNVSFPFLFDVYVCLVCTHILLHVCMCVGVLEYMCMCVCIPLMSYVFPHCLPLYLLRVSPWIWSLTISRYPTRNDFSASWVLLLQWVPRLPDFYVGSGDLNARLHVWVLKHFNH